MAPVFVDTGGWIGLVVKRDQFHQEEFSYYQNLSQQKTPDLTTNYVLIETYTRIRYDDGHDKALQFHDIITKAVEVRRLRLEWITLSLYERGWNIFLKYKDQKFSFVDCTSFAVARQANVREIFGFDQNFSTMGFILKPSFA